MRRRPVRLRVFILGTVLALLVVPTLAGSAAWAIERNREQSAVHGHLSDTFAYLTSHRAEMNAPSSVQGLATLLDRFGLVAQLIAAGNSEKKVLFLSGALKQAQTRTSIKTAATVAPGPGSSWIDDHRVISTGPKSGTILVADVYYRPAPGTTPALAGLVTGLVVLLAGLGIAVWLAGRWMVTPLTRLSAEVDKVAGGDLAVAVPSSRIREVANIAQAVEGLTAALGETAQRRAEADEARRFLVTSVAHDLRTPLFALRGHLQAIGSGLGDPALHLQRAEARADALERLIGNLFAYTRDDYAQPALHLEPVPVPEVLEEVAAGLDHTARLSDNTFELEGDRALVAVVDRDRVKRALTNIFDNAVRYSPQGASIGVTWAAGVDSTVRVIVQDHGRGIDPLLLPHVFEPGIRGAGAGKHDGGAGLGLTIAKRFLEQQHASIAVHNGPDGGATITITLQRAA